MERITRSLFHRWFTKRQEISFLFTLLFLFFMSSGYLVMRVWGSPDSQGAAAGLQAPVTPPSLDSSAPAPVADSKADEAPQAVEPAVAPVEAPKADASVETPLVVGEPLSASQELPVALPASAALGAEKKAVVQEPKASPQAASPAKTGVDRKSKKGGKSKPSPKPPTENAADDEKTPVVVAAPLTPTVSPQPSKSPSPKKKSKKVSPKKEPEYSLDTPEGWKWFAAPLGYVFVDGQLKVDVIASISEQVLVSDEALTFETPEDMILANAVAIEDEGDTLVQPQPQLTGSPAVETPANPEPRVTVQVKPDAEELEEEVLFQKALAKVERNREKRALEAARYRVELPSHGGSSSVVPSSLMRLKDAVSSINARGTTPSAENPTSTPLPSGQN